MTTGARGAARPEATGAASLTADARVEHGVEHVDGEIDENEAERDDQDAALHERKVAGQDPLHHQCAYARPRENRLRQHRAAEEVTDRKSTRLNSSHVS